MLVEDGWQVTIAGDVVAGLEAVRRGPFDVVITDAQMHRRGGLDFLEQALELRPELWDRFVFMRLESGSESLSDAAVPDILALAALRSEVQRIVGKTNGKVSRLPTG